MPSYSSFTTVHACLIALQVRHVAPNHTAELALPSYHFCWVQPSQHVPVSTWMLSPCHRIAPKKNYMLWPLPSLERKPVMPLLLRFRSFRFQVWDSGWNLINRTLVLCSCPFKMILDNLNFYNWRTRHCWYIGRAFKCWWAKNMNKYLLNNAKSLPMGRGCHYARLNDLFNFLKY